MENLTNVQITMEELDNIYEALLDQAGLMHFRSIKYLAKTLVDQDGNKHLIFSDEFSSKEEDAKRRFRLKNIYNALFEFGSICSDRTANCIRNISELDIPSETELGSVDVITLMSIVDLETYFDSDLKLMSYTMAWIYK